MHLRKAAIVTAVSSAVGLLSVVAYAAAPISSTTLPGNGTVEAGSVTAGTNYNAATAGNTIHSAVQPGSAASGSITIGSGNTVINWGSAPVGQGNNNGFDIGSAASFTVNGPSTGSAASLLNVDSSGNPSYILGTLTASNAEVFVANANGIVVGGSGTNPTITLPNGGGFYGFNVDSNNNLLSSAPQYPGDVNIESGTISNGGNLIIAGAQVTNAGTINSTGAVAAVSGYQPNSGVVSAFSTTPNTADWSSSTQTVHGAFINATGGKITASGLTAVDNAGFVNQGTMALGTRGLNVINNAGTVTLNGGIQSGGAISVANNASNAAGQVNINGALTSVGQTTITATGGIYLGNTQADPTGAQASSSSVTSASGVSLWAGDASMGGGSLVNSQSYNIYIGGNSSIAAPQVALRARGMIVSDNMAGQTYPISANQLLLQSAYGQLTSSGTGNIHSLIGAYSPAKNGVPENINLTGMGVTPYNSGQTVQIYASNNSIAPQVSLNVSGSADYYYLNSTMVGNAAVSAYQLQNGFAGSTGVAGALGNSTSQNSVTTNSATGASAKGIPYQPFQTGSQIGAQGIGYGAMYVQASGDLTLNPATDNNAVPGSVAGQSTMNYAYVNPSVPTVTNNAPGAYWAPSSTGYVLMTNPTYLPAALEFSGATGFNAGGDLNVNLPIINVGQLTKGAGIYLSAGSGSSLNFTNGAWFLMGNNQILNVNQTFTSGNLPALQWYNGGTVMPQLSAGGPQSYNLLNTTVQNLFNVMANSQSTASYQSTTPLNQYLPSNAS